MKQFTKATYFGFFILSILFFQSMESVAQPPPVLCMPFNGNALDISGNNHHGFVDGATLTSDRFGNPNSAFDFDGVDDHIQILDSIGNIFFSNELTIIFWARTESVWNNSPFLLMPNNNSDRLNIHIHYNNSGILSTFWDYGDISNDGRLYIPGIPFQTTWEHYAFVISETLDSMIVYKNGVVQGAKAGSSTLFDRSRHLNIGGGISGNTNCHFHGQIDDVQIFNVALTQSEVTDNFINSNTCMNSTSLNPQLTNSDISLFPNPGTDRLYLTGLNNGFYEIRIFDIKYAEIKSFNINVLQNKTLTFDINDLINGVYFVKIISRNSVHTQKLIVKKFD